MRHPWIRYFLIITFCYLPFSATWATLQIRKQEAMQIGGKIWRNEGRGQVKYLMWWNKGENFASLGIGHFIWYPKDQSGPFNNVFPKFLKFARAHRTPLPFWLENSQDWYCPWPSREDFFQQQESPAALSLKAFLLDTIPLQVQFMAQRLEDALPTMLAKAPKAHRARIQRAFNTLASTPEGRYALMDYINFKGEGTLATERYAGQGWGLLQVLQRMHNFDEATALATFVASARNVLVERVKNSPPARGERRWLTGWNKRLDTYLTVDMAELKKQARVLRHMVN